MIQVSTLKYITLNAIGPDDAYSHTATRHDNSSSIAGRWQIFMMTSKHGLHEPNYILLAAVASLHTIPKA